MGAPEPSNLPTRTRGSQLKPKKMPPHEVRKMGWQDPELSTQSSYVYTIPGTPDVLLVRWENGDPLLQRPWESCPGSAHILSG